MQKQDDINPIDMGNMDKSALVDMSGFPLDPALSPAERAAAFSAACPDPHCYRVGQVGVKLAFADGGKTLQSALTELMIRQRDAR